jgi:hypothetical protein
VTATSRTHSEDPQALPARRKPKAATADHLHIPSPAQAMQLRLNAILADESGLPDIKKWSGRRSSAVIVGVSCALWIGAAAIVRLVLT